MDKNDCGSNAYTSTLSNQQTMSMDLVLFSVIARSPNIIPGTYVKTIVPSSICA